MPPTGSPSAATGPACPWRPEASRALHTALQIPQGLAGSNVSLAAAANDSVLA